MFQKLLQPGVHLGYQRRERTAGRWILRRFIGTNKYRLTPLGLADDLHDDNGTTILSFAQAAVKARAMVVTSDGDTVVRLTVRQAMDRYVEHKRHLGQSVADVMSRGTAPRSASAGGPRGE